MKLKEGDIILFKGTSYISKAIEFATRSPYSHSACYVGNGFIIEADWGGVIYSRLDGKYHKTEYDVYRHKTASRLELAIAIEYMMLQEGKGYDYLGVYGILKSMVFLRSDNPFDNKNKVWCQELVMDGYIAAQLPVDCHPNTSRCAPRDTAADKNFERVM